ncbi:MAG TPA: DUF370 domain-containing protein [Firmicutes bacterium]|nr:DUF370 domain-containing protein [Bacillota bacterium]
MFTHIGGSRVVYSKEVVGIFHLPQRENEINKEFIESSFSNFLSGRELKRNKSFIVTADKVILSPISPLTLAKRSKTEIYPG